MKINQYCLSIYGVSYFPVPELEFTICLMPRLHAIQGEREAMALALDMWEAG